MSTKDFSSKQERTIADFLGWDVVSGSGARACHPGDIIGDEWLGECKTHETPGQKIFFSSAVWSKISDEAISLHRKPVLFTDDGSQKIDRTWCVINRFAVDPSWIVNPFNKRFKAHILRSHSDLAEMYQIEDIINGLRDPSCYSADLGSFSVIILPLRLFKYMIE